MDLIASIFRQCPLKKKKKKNTLWEPFTCILLCGGVVFDSDVDGHFYIINSPDHLSSTYE